MTSGSVESIWIGDGLGQRDALDDLAHLLVLVLALGQRDADVEHVRAALDLVLGDLHEAVVVVGEQQLLGLARALRVDALADQRRARVLHERRGGDHRARHVRRARRGARADGRGRRSARRSRAMCVGRRAAAAADDRHAVALDELAERRRPAARAPRGRSSRRRGPGAAGRRSGCSGRAPGEYSPRKRIASRMSSGPVEQFRPMTSTFSASSVVSTRVDVGAEQHLAAVGQQRDARSGSAPCGPTRLNASRAPKIAALTSRMSCAVSMMMQVDAALEQARGLLGEDLDELAEA